MLSTNIKSIRDSDLDGDFFVSEKYDGVRALWTGEKLVTRTKREFSFVPEWFLDQLPRGIPLDGEMIVPGKDFSYFSSITVRKTNDDRWKEVQYMVFDTPVENMKFEERKKKLKRIIYEMSAMNVSLVPFRLVRDVKKNRSVVDRMFNMVVRNGGEGVMLIKADSEYRPKRVRTLIKYKKELDGEATVVDYIEGTGKYVGKMGKLKCVLPTKKTFFIGTGFNDAQRECYEFHNGGCKINIPDNSILDVPRIGSLVTFTCMEFTKTGVPRLPVFKSIRFDMTLRDMNDLT